MTSSHSEPHSDIGPELRQLAQAILDRLDPAVRSAAAMAAESLRGPGRCEQVWCPVCALAALVSGEQHPMLTVIAEHSVALMTVLRTMAADPQTQAEAGPEAEPEAEPEARPESGRETDGAAPILDGSSNGSTRYQHIPIVVEPLAEPLAEPEIS